MKLMLTCKCGSHDFSYNKDKEFVCNECGETGYISNADTIGLQRQPRDDYETIPYMSQMNVDNLKWALTNLHKYAKEVDEGWPAASSIGSTNYPFGPSFNELLPAIKTWVDSFIAELAKLATYEWEQPIIQAPPLPDYLVLTQPSEPHRCSNCKNQLCEEYEMPCAVCSRDKWEPQSAEPIESEQEDFSVHPQRVDPQEATDTCDSCLHVAKTAHDMPCTVCSHASYDPEATNNWEPNHGTISVDIKPIRKPKIATTSCMTCKHTCTAAYIAPCNTCTHNSNKPNLANITKISDNWEGEEDGQ